MTKIIKVKKQEKIQLSSGDWVIITTPSGEETLCVFTLLDYNGNFNFVEIDNNKAEIIDERLYELPAMSFKGLLEQGCTIKKVDVSIKVSYS